MSSPTPVTMLRHDQSNESPFGPGTLENRTAQVGFTELGVWFLTFPSGGHADPWTLHYEETIYVVEGEASVVTIDGVETETRATAGELFAIAKGTSVRFRGEPGTPLLVSLAPANWRERLTTSD